MGKASRGARSESKVSSRRVLRVAKLHFADGFSSRKAPRRRLLKRVPRRTTTDATRTTRPTNLRELLISPPKRIPTRRRRPVIDDERVKGKVEVRSELVMLFRLEGGMEMFGLGRRGRGGGELGRVVVRKRVGNRGKRKRRTSIDMMVRKSMKKRREEEGCSPRIDLKTTTTMLPSSPTLPSSFFLVPSLPTPTATATSPRAPTVNPLIHHSTPTDPFLSIQLTTRSIVNHRTARTMISARLVFQGIVTSISMKHDTPLKLNEPSLRWRSREGRGMLELPRRQRRRGGIDSLRLHLLLVV